MAASGGGGGGGSAGGSGNATTTTSSSSCTTSTITGSSPPGASAAGAATTEREPGWEVAVRPLLSASYSAFEMRELPQLLASVIDRWGGALPQPGGPVRASPRDGWRPPSRRVTLAGGLGGLLSGCGVEGKRGRSLRAHLPKTKAL